MPIGNLQTDEGLMSGLGDMVARGLSVDQMRALGPLREDDQELIDEAIVQVGVERLTIVRDVLESGLRFNLDDPFGVLELSWDRMSKVGNVRRGMTFGTGHIGEDSVADLNRRTLPIYLEWDDFSYNSRILRAAARNNTPLETAQVGQITRRINESVEDAMISGIGLVVDGNGVPGMLNAPGVNLFAYASNESWLAAGHTGPVILADVLGMIDLAQAADRPGPYTLAVNRTYGNKLNEDYLASGGNNNNQTIFARLEEVVTGSGDKLRVIIADRLPLDRTILYQRTSDVVDMVMGQEPTAISWTTQSGGQQRFIVFAFMIPRVRDDYEGKSGIVAGDLT